MTNQVSLPFTFIYTCIIIYVHNYMCNIIICVYTYAYNYTIIIIILYNYNIIIIIFIIIILYNCDYKLL